MQCPSCGSNEVATLRGDIKFPYGFGDDAVMLKAEVQKHTCQVCMLQFLDDSAEDRKHEAICRHEGLLSFPAHFRSIRKMEKWTQAEMGKVMGVDEATIDKWENGIELHTKTADQLLFLLSNWSNRRLLNPKRD